MIIINIIIIIIIIIIISLASSKYGKPGIGGNQKQRNILNE